MTRIFHRHDTRHRSDAVRKSDESDFPSTFIGRRSTHTNKNVCLTPHQPPNTVSLCVTKAKDFFFVVLFCFLPECGEILNFIEEKFTAAKKRLKKGFLFGICCGRRHIIGSWPQK
jgi:hypothetical protein